MATELAAEQPNAEPLGVPGKTLEDSSHESQSTTVIAVASADCFPVFISRSDYKSLPQRQMLAYELEESLPFDGDNLAIDTLESSEGWLAVATHASDLIEEVERLENSGQYVRAITPTLLLAWASLSKEQNLKKVDILLWQSEDGIDAVAVKSGIPVAWRWIADATENVEAAILPWAKRSDTCELLALDCDAAIIQGLETQCNVTSLALTRAEAAVAEIDRITTGRSRPILDLRNGLLESTDRLHPIKRSLFLFVTCAILAQLGILGAVLARDWQYRGETTTLVVKQEEVFQQIFPNQSIPVGLTSRLESEHRRLAGTRGMASNDLPHLESVVPITHVLLSTLPEQTQARYRLDWISILPDEVEFTGAARSYADLETISQGMEVGGLEVPPVSSNKTTEGVSLRFTGIRFRETEGDAE